MLFFISDGRLGNQLFQYAFLNTIAKKDERLLAVNMTQLLAGFDLKNPAFKQVELSRYSFLILKKIIKPLFLDILAKIKVIGYIRQERNGNFVYPSFSRSKGLLPITLVESDFFQSESFFKNGRINFSIKEKYINMARSVLADISDQYTKVFVHVRRGDYLFESYLGERGINLPIEYFDQAMEIICKDVDNPFFIFLSDDPEFVKYCFNGIDNKIIPENDMVTDLAIMSLCDYGIVSNSSFSWWGAYLMNNRKKAIFPKYWYGWKFGVDSHVSIQPDWGVTVDFLER